MMAAFCVFGFGWGSLASTRIVSRENYGQKMKGPVRDSLLTGPVNHPDSFWNPSDSGGASIRITHLNQIVKPFLEVLKCL